MNWKKAVRFAGLVAALNAGAWLPAHAQPYPGKPIRIVVPNAPGGGTDSAARAVANRLAPALGQQILVENRPGAGGRLAAEFVAKAAPDGYTLLLGSAATLIMAKALYRKLNYDLLTSFAPISLVGTTAYLLVTHPSVPAPTVRQLVAALPHIGSGRLRSRGVTSARRSAIVPSIPTIAEAALPRFEVVQYYSVVAPAGTESRIITRLNQEIASRMPAPEAKKALEAQGTEVVVSSADELARLIAAAIGKWTAVIRNAGIKPD